MSPADHKLTVLINPDWREMPAPGRFPVDRPYFPLELMYIEAGLKRRGRPVALADMWGRTMPPPELRATLARAAFVVMTTAPTYVFWRDGICDVEFPTAQLRRIREWAPQARIVAIGPQGTTLPETLAPAPLDYLIRGEPDAVVPELIDRLLAGDPDAERLPGVCTRREGRLQISPDNAVVDRLDELPPLDFESVLLGEYVQPAYEASRGCPYACTFCFRDGFREKFRAKSPERIREELGRLAATGHRFVVLIDEIFGMRGSWLDAFCELIAPHDLLWAVQTRVECLTEERVERMVAAGLTSLEVGLESADPDVARGVGKDSTDLDKLERCVRRACELGVRQVRMFCIYGLPGETRASIARTEEYLFRFADLEAVQLDIYPLIPLPGTRIWREAVEQGYPLRDWGDGERFAGVINNAFERPEVVDRLCRLTQRKWDYRRLRAALARSWRGRLALWRMRMTIRYPFLMGLRGRLLGKSARREVMQ